MAKKIVTIVGNRPQFIKMAPVSCAIQKAGYQEIVVHTGQHYDKQLNDIFFQELNLPTPDYQLITQEKSHGKMTAELLSQLETLFLNIKPQTILVYGDTNSTLAASLAAVKMGIQIAHVEAGPRLHDLNTPEEVNRIIADHMSTLRFCPDATSVQNLKKENITQGVYFVGDVMYDLFLQTKEKALNPSSLLETYQLPKAFVLLTLHRPNNVDDPNSLKRLLALIQKMDRKVLFPMHLRTVAKIKHYGLYEAFESQPNLILTEPLGYFDMMAALQHCSFVLTDSGGLQKEAFFASKPCFVCFYETPWPEILTSNWQVLLGTLSQINLDKLLETIQHFQVPSTHPPFFGDGDAAEKIVRILEANHFFYEEALG